MNRVRFFSFALWIGLAGVMVAACGGGEGAPTPVSPSPTAIRLPATPTAPTATLVPAATPTSAPTAAPTAASKRGGTLNLRELAPVAFWDTYDIRPNTRQVNSNYLNNLIWADPYGDGHTLAGDLAERWEISQDGTVLTFFVRKGVEYHDGASFTSRDVAYNLERGWKAPIPTMTVFKNRFAPIKSIDTPSDSVVRVTLSAPSNSFLASLSTALALMYPAHLPFPAEQWKPVGTGPFKVESVTADRIVLVRNNRYWRQGLPYVDGIVYTVIVANELAVGVMRAGKLDVEHLAGSVVELLYDSQRPSPGPPNVFLFTSFSVNGLYVNRRAPWTDPKVREAVSLALDRQAVNDIWLKGRGSPYAAPLMSPERGGQWGISEVEMKGRPGFRADKTADLARAKALLADAGVDPSKVTANIIGLNLIPELTEVPERNLAGLGFRTKLEILTTAQSSERNRQGTFDFLWVLGTISVDDPSDYLGPWVLTGGPSNYANWSNPKLDTLFAEQDRTLDPARRKQLVTEVQEIVLTDRIYLPLVHRTGIVWHMEWAKNYPSKLPFFWSQRYRLEQVWLDK